MRSGGQWAVWIIWGRRGLLIVNPRCGKGGPDAGEFAREAKRLGVAVHVLRTGDDAAEIARAAGRRRPRDGRRRRLARARRRVALERDLPFVCVPFGTRNHFARDIGLDRSDPFAALAAFKGRRAADRRGPGRTSASS